MKRKSEEELKSTTTIKKIKLEETEKILLDVVKDFELKILKEIV